MCAKQSHLKRKLKDIINSEPDTIKAAVATEALDYHDIRDFFNDLLHHGCQSGMVGSLIYYSDTHAFFDKHYREIEELRYEYGQQLGVPLQPNGDLKNWYAWFAFEETARAIANELEIQY
ncbi:MAG: hypothetical protein J0L80_02425 [Chitinophagales bacterium]|nr:hypothetical protein [Chitinophagales bacterium]